MTTSALVSRLALAAALSTIAAAAAAQDSAPPAATPDTAGPPAPASGGAGDQEIIVTGTRATGVTVAESAAPIKLVGAEAISHVGQPNLNQVLTQLVPSFNAAAFGGDTAQLTLSARLRGLSPNHTLVLVNGKRRHGTANLAVLSGVSQGGAAPDLDFIIPGAIQRIEVLEDGAAAQYGSDAIAGVINIITKSASEGGSASVTAGQYYRGDGETIAGTANLGAKLGENGFINLTGMYRFKDRSQVGGIDRRLSLPDGSLLPTLTATQRALYGAIPGYPYVNKINGDPLIKLAQGSYNAGYDLGDVQLYSFGTYGHRTASAIENFRVPDRVVRTAAGQTVYFARQGFDPKEKFREDDLGITGGIKGDLSGWAWDLSATYGRDRARVYTVDSANASLFVDTGFTPSDFYDGTFISSELTVNADVRREIDAGMAEPITVAFGAQYLRNTYQIKSGDAGSTYKEGGQSYPGFQVSDAGFYTRNAESLYLDVALTPVDGLKLDGAVRYEHYSDFGSKVIGKLTGRYDFTPEFALRGTVSNGFRAPTLAEQRYSATNVSPTSAFVQLPANSDAAKVLGFDDLKPEKSFNVSVGTVIRPTPRLTFTVDGYYIKIKDRIVGSGSLYGIGGATNIPAVLRAITATGRTLDPTVSQVGVQAFTNGLDTRTLGVDVVASYSLPTDRAGTFTFTVSGNYNDNKVTHIDAVPAPIALPGISLFDRTAVSLLETSAPKAKVIFGLNWALGPVSVVARETVFGPASVYYSPNGGTYYRNRIGTGGTTDLELGFNFTRRLKLSAGANNLFDKKPPTVRAVPGSGPRFTLTNAANNYDGPMSFSAYGINGGYYYARIDWDF